MRLPLTHGNENYPEQIPSADTPLGLPRWYAVNVLTGKEETAEWHLRRQGFSPFLPRQKRTVRHARRFHVRLVPFFPSYMFVSLDLEIDRWRSINGTFGVRSLIMQGQRPVPCPVGLVEQLIACADGEGLIDLSNGLETGRAVRILSGPFAELIGTLEKFESSDRVRVLLNVMNRGLTVRMDVKDLSAA